MRPLLLWVLPLVVVALGVYWYGSGGRYASTDNAYLKQDRVDVAPQISGDVRDVRVLENAAVEPGDVVLVLDDTLLQVASSMRKPSWLPRSSKSNRCAPPIARRSEKSPLHARLHGLR